jgi:hypothetical protein
MPTVLVLATLIAAAPAHDSFPRKNLPLLQDPIWLPIKAKKTASNTGT